MSRLAIFALAIVVSCGSASAQLSDKKYGPGVTDQEIKLGQTVPIAVQFRRPLHSGVERSPTSKR